MNFQQEAEKNFARVFEDESIFSEQEKHDQSSFASQRQLKKEVLHVDNRGNFIFESKEGGKKRERRRNNKNKNFENQQIKENQKKHQQKSDHFQQKNQRHEKNQEYKHGQKQGKYKDRRNERKGNGFMNKEQVIKKEKNIQHNKINQRNDQNGFHKDKKDKFEEGKGLEKSFNHSKYQAIYEVKKDIQIPKNNFDISGFKEEEKEFPFQKNENNNLEIKSRKDNENFDKFEEELELRLMREEDEEREAEERKSQQKNYISLQRELDKDFSANQEQKDFQFAEKNQDVKPQWYDSPEELKHKKYLRREKVRAEKELPIYLKRTEIMNQVINNKFSIVVGDTGCGKSTQLPQYLFEHYENIPNSKILWVLPRKLPTLSLSERVCEEMDINLGEEIGFEVPFKNRSSKRTLLKFITDTILINELIKKRNEVGPQGEIILDYSIVVLDEVHERNLYTDILLATLKDIALASNMKMLVTSATINEAVFEKYFDTTSIKVQGRPYPVELDYHPIPYNMAAVQHMANTICDIVEKMNDPLYNYNGHILLFTAGVDDIIKVRTKVYELFEERRINESKYEVLPLHGLLAPAEQQAIFNDTGKVKIILSTRMAETALTIDGVRVVIDIGYDKETIYDAVKRMTVVEDKPIPQSSAIQRAGRAGRTSSGLCIRLYSLEDFEKLSRNKMSEIQRMNLGKVVLKLKAMGVVNLKEFDFVERPNEIALAQTIDHMMELGALDKETENLTHIGQAMLKLETDPDFSKVILEGLQRDCVEEVIEIIGMIGVNLRLFKRGFDDDTREAADKKKLGFCHEKGDLLTLLEIFRFWFKKSKEERHQWCSKNYFSYHALNQAFKTTKDLRRNLGEVQKILDTHKRNTFKKKFTNEEELKKKVEMALLLNFEKEIDTDPIIKQQKQHDNILKCFLSAFYPNVCLYTNVPKIGYTLLRDNLTIRMHGASSLSLAQDYPKYLFCIDINKTSFNNSKMVSVIQQEWLEELFPNYANNPKLDYLTKSYTYTNFSIPKLSKWILGQFEFKRDEEIKEMADSSETTFYSERNEERLQVYTASSNPEEIKQKFTDLINRMKKKLEQETIIVPLTLKTRGVFQAGGKVKEILFTGETLSLSFDNFDPYYTKEKLERIFNKIGDVDSISTEVDKGTNLTRGVITTNTHKDASQILAHYHGSRLVQYGDCRSKLSPKIEPIPFRLNSAAKRALRLRIEWFVGISQGSTFLKFENTGYVNEFLNSFEGKGLRFEGQYVRMGLPRGRNNFLCVVRAKDPKNLIIKNLKAINDEIDMEKTLREYKLDRGLIRAINFRDNVTQSWKVDQLTEAEYKEAIRQIITRKLGVEDTDIIRMEAFHPKTRDFQAGQAWKPVADYKRRVEVDVYDLNIAKKIIQYFDGKEDLEYLTRGRMHCSLSFSRKYQLNEKKYRIIQNEVEKFLEDTKNRKGVSMRYIIETNNKKKNPFDNKTENEVGIRIITQDPLSLDECCDALNPIVLGVRYYLKTFSQCRKAEVKSTKDSLKLIERNRKVTIEYEKERKVLNVFGPQEKRAKAITDIEALFQSEDVNGFQKVSVSFKYKRVRHILENNSALLVDVERQYDVRVKYSLMKKEIEISGKGEKVFVAEKEVIKLVNMHGEKGEPNENECPICMEPFIEGYRLQLCNHKYCFSCLEAELNEGLNNNPQFPICCSLCAGEGKKQEICLKDLSQIFPRATIQILWERSIEANLKQFPDLYMRCYSPDCPQIFRQTQEKFFSCDYCLEDYCKVCKVKAHPSGECDSVAKRRVLFTLNRDGVDAKECPQCQFIIIRSEGCDKMKCTSCHTIFCWLCREIFPTEGNVYAHLNERHGQ